MGDASVGFSTTGAKLNSNARANCSVCAAVTAGMNTTAGGHDLT
jgi:hypothetical protein